MNEIPNQGKESSLRSNRHLIFFLSLIRRHVSFLFESSATTVQNVEPLTPIYRLDDRWEWEEPLWDEPNYKQEMMAGSTSVPYSVDSDY